MSEHEIYQQGRSSFDDMTRDWDTAILGPEPDVDIQRRKFLEEVDEVFTAETDEDMALEIGDVVNVAISMLHIAGYTLDDVMRRVDEKNRRNYPPERMQELLAVGYSRPEAIRVMKATRNGAVYQYPLPNA
jgi:phosphoribosyl-ATP pyrophosphohydrolase